MVGLRPSSSLSTGCVVSLRGDWAIFCHTGSGRVGRESVISQRKIPWNTPPWLGIEPGPRGGQTVSYPTELSWPNLCFRYGHISVASNTHLTNHGSTPRSPTAIFTSHEGCLLPLFLLNIYICIYPFITVTLLSSCMVQSWPLFINGWPYRLLSGLINQKWEAPL